MNRINHHRFASRKAAVISTIVCVLAMMIIVVSCPLKRMLHNRVFSNTSPVAKSNHAAKTINNNNVCFFAKDKIFSLKPELSGKHTLPSPLSLPAIYEQPRADIHYSLSSLPLTDFNAAFNHYAELPLFLQQSRLLI
jgi:hypothetical protein